MKAIVKTQPGEGHLELLDWVEPEPDSEQVKIRVAGCGICGTDIHIVQGNWACRPPVVLGHEWAGTVVSAGSHVTAFQAGDRVVASNPSKTCGACYYCLAGNPFMCVRRVSAGYMIDGAFADYICIDARRCHKLPDSVPFRAAALGEPISVAVHAVIERSTVHSGDLVVVSGPGCIGLLTAQVAKLEGARVVLAGLGRDAARLRCGREIGADAVVNVDEQDLAEVVAGMSGGAGADIVYETAGSEKSLDACWNVVRKQGTVVSVGVHPGVIRTAFGNIMMKELTVIGTYGYVWTSWQRTVRLLAEGKLNIDAMISHELPLEQFGEGFRLTMDGSAIKVILNPELSRNGESGR
jgi:L-iditol 2-dehydrogenase